MSLVTFLEGSFSLNFRSFLNSSSGSFSVVRRGLHKKSGADVAIKCLQKKMLKLNLLEREIKIMKTVGEANLSSF